MAALRRSSYLNAAAPSLLRLSRLAFAKCYRSSNSTIPGAAQPLVDPDYYFYDDDDDEEEGCGSAPRRDRVNLSSASQDASAELDRFGREGGVRWAFVGYKGRRVYAEMLSELLEVPRISVSCLVRQDLSPRSSLYKQIADAVNCGRLVPEDIIFGLLAKRLEDGYWRGETGFILDGIPRTRVQAEILDQFIDIDLVVNFKCIENQRMENYRSSILPQDKPLEDYYKKQKKLVDVPIGSGAPGDTWQELLSALRLRHINAVHRKLPPGSSQ